MYQIEKGSILFELYWEEIQTHDPDTLKNNVMIWSIVLRVHEMVAWLLSKTDSSFDQLTKFPNY